MSNNKTYRVSFYMRDIYRIDLQAACAANAIEQATILFENQHTEPFELDVTIGGDAEDWSAEEVQS